jgi:hypothetical protein
LIEIKFLLIEKEVIIYNELLDFTVSLDEFHKPEKKLIYSNSISIGIAIIVCMYSILHLF